MEGEGGEVAEGDGGAGGGFDQDAAEVVEGFLGGGAGSVFFADDFGEVVQGDAFGAHGRTVKDDVDGVHADDADAAGDAGGGDLEDFADGDILGEVW